MIKVSILNINVNNITLNGSLNIGKTVIIKPTINYDEEKNNTNEKVDEQE
ncbi:hypothetical protein [Alkalihalobacterium alkalinitrilicum]|nr:hypothetical protein [Alkalihalobacterium alkalinitrilicum]